jgi:solute carrier family 13 (sodium-dependent dicarboxylate transporter), member 2/3/5
VSHRLSIVTATINPPRTRSTLGGFTVGAVLIGLSVVVFALPEDLSGDARITLAVFVAATGAWALTRIDDTYIALGAAALLTLTGVIDSDRLFATLGSDIIWLLIAAFVLAAGVTATGLPARAVTFLVAGAGSVRQLMHLVTAALVATSFAVPATSGRAALAIPVFTTLATLLTGRTRVALALLFPTVILLSAVATLIGAGAHLITSQVLEAATGTGIDFVRWLILGLPLAVVSSHLATELILLLFTRRADRRQPLRPYTLADHGPLSGAEKVAAAVVCAVILLWCTEPLHHLPPALVALCGALAISLPGGGTTTIGGALKTVPWSLLVFMAATAALGAALLDSGAATWLADRVFGPLAGNPGWLVLGAIVTVSTMAHLAIQSRSARSSVLVPLVIPLAMAAGIDPALAAFASTAAAGFCHTLPASAKPVAMFADLDGVPTYSKRDLLRLAALLAPLHIVLVSGFAIAVWPHL